MNETIDRIDRLRHKVGVDPNSLGACLPEEEIAMFERTYGIQLPEAFRLFLINVGNGGSGPPEYGLNTLTKSVRRGPDGRYETSDTPDLRPDLSIPTYPAVGLGR